MHAWLYVLAVLAILQGVTQVASTGDQTSVSALTTTTTSSSISSSSSRSSNSISFSSISNPDESNHRPSTSDDSVAQSESEVDEDSLERPAAGELHLQTDPFASVVDDDDDDEDDDKDEDDTDSDNSLDFSDSSSSSGSHSSDSDSDSNSKPDPEALVEIEKNLLSLFGFPKRPKIDRTKVVIPEAMKQLYAQIMGHDLVDSVNVPKEGLNTRNANTVRSFTHEGNFLYLFFSFIYDNFVMFVQVSESFYSKDVQYDITEICIEGGYFFASKKA